MLLKLLKLLVSIITVILIAHLFALGVAALNLAVQPRAVEPLNWISETFVTRPLGVNATIIWLLAWLGLAALLLTLRYFAGEIGNYQPRERRSKEAADPEPAPQRRRTVGKPAVARNRPDPDPMWAVLTALEEENDRVIGPQPAWQLLPLTNDADCTVATSWLGGMPFAPPQLQWPMFSDGRSLMFLAQIDLAQLKPCPQTGQRPAGLPQDGTMLFWLGFDGTEQWEYDVQWYSTADMARAVDHAMPTGAMKPRDLGLFSHEPAMQRTPVRLHCVMDDEDTPLVSKLMGIEICDLAYGYRFPTDWQNLLFIKHDDAIGTASEHWQGMAIACPAADLERGAFHGGRLEGITNG